MVVCQGPNSDISWSIRPNIGAFFMEMPVEMPLFSELQRYLLRTVQQEI